MRPHGVNDSRRRGGGDGAARFTDDDAVERGKGRGREDRGRSGDGGQ
jgi:hypothetical protein